jgi:hypothetical protein
MADRDDFVGVTNGVVDSNQCALFVYPLLDMWQHDPDRQGYFAWADSSAIGVAATTQRMPPSGDLNWNWDGYASGTFTDDTSTPLAGATIRLYWRSTGELIGRTYAATNGTYSFTGLGYPQGAASTPGDYQIVFIDPAGGTVFNDMIHSQFTPGQ